MSTDLMRGRLLLWGTAFTAAALGGLPAFQSPAAAAAGVVGPATGGCLFLALARTLRLPSPARLRPVRALWLAAGAAFEELVWRGAALAWLAARAGLPAALALTTAGFATAHRGRHGARASVHLVTGAGFGAAFACGGLVAAMLAHAVYNLLVDLRLRAQA